MINEELINYIKKRNSEGGKKEDIINELSSGDWEIKDINEAYSNLTATKIENNVVSVIKHIANLGVYGLLLLWLGMYTVNVFWRSGGITEKISLSIVWLLILILLPIILVRKKSKKKTKALKINPTEENSSVNLSNNDFTNKSKSPSITKRLIYSIYIFFGLLILVCFFSFEYFYHPGTPQTAKESNIVFIMYMVAFVVPISTFFLRKRE